MPGAVVCRRARALVEEGAAPGVRLDREARLRRVETAADPVVSEAGSRVAHQVRAPTGEDRESEPIAGIRISARRARRDAAVHRVSRVLDDDGRGILDGD